MARRETYGPTADRERTARDGGNGGDDATRRHRLGLAAAAGGGAVLVGALVAHVGGDDAWPLDRRVRGWLANGQHPVLHAALRAVGTAGTIAVYAPATALAAGAVARRRGRMQAAPLVAAVAGATLAHVAIKHAVQRPRPPLALAAGNERPSFPSGHATRAAAAAAAIGYAVVRERIAPRRAALPLAIAIPASVGVSRAYVDAHWTTDVVGGWGLGAATAALCALWYERLRRRGGEVRA